MRSHFNLAATDVMISSGNNLALTSHRPRVTHQRAVNPVHPTGKTSQQQLPPKERVVQGEVVERVQETAAVRRGLSNTLEGWTYRAQYAVNHYLSHDERMMAVGQGSLVDAYA